MTHPRLLARIAGVFYALITLSAMFAYLYVRAQIILPGNMPQTVANLLAQEQPYRLGFASAVITVVSNPPMGLLLYELLKVVNRRVALLALVFITISTTIEAMNLLNYIAPLLTVTLPEYRAGFGPAEVQALVRGAVKLWGYTFNVSLIFFGVFCALTGWLIIKSKFLPTLLGILMIVAGANYWFDGFSLFLSLPEIPYLDKVLQFAPLGEIALALWLLVFGVNEAKWQQQVEAPRPRTA